jgi:cytoskeletal protein CcmA (bactofilin family)
MALFDKSNKQADHSANTTTIAAGSNFNGKVDIQCALHIDGEVKGDINSTSTVVIGKTGVFNGELSADKLIISGKFLGSADCKIIEVVSGGAAEGKLTATQLMIDAESIFQGQSIKKGIDNAGENGGALRLASNVSKPYSDTSKEEQ